METCVSDRETDCYTIKAIESVHANKKEKRDRWRRVGWERLRYEKMKSRKVDDRLP